MNLSYIRYFVELAHVQHYTNAARNLNITQPSLSHAISQLEEELGVMLFEKNGRNTELTAFGREFLACAERSLGTLDAGVESIKKGGCRGWRDTAWSHKTSWNGICTASGSGVFEES